MLRTLEFKLGWVSEAEFEAVWRPIDEATGKTSPMLWCFDSDFTSAYWQARTYFGWADDNPSQTVKGFVQTAGGNNRFEKQFKLTSVI